MRQRRAPSSVDASSPSPLACWMPALSPRDDPPAGILVVLLCENTLGAQVSLELPWKSRTIRAITLSLGASHGLLIEYAPLAPVAIEDASSSIQQGVSYAHGCTYRTKSDSKTLQHPPDPRRATQGPALRPAEPVATGTQRERQRTLHHRSPAWTMQSRVTSCGQKIPDRQQFVLGRAWRWPLSASQVGRVHSPCP